MTRERERERERKKEKTSKVTDYSISDYFIKFIGLAERYEERNKVADEMKLVEEKYIHLSLCVSVLGESLCI